MQLTNRYLDPARAGLSDPMAPMAWRAECGRRAWSSLVRWAAWVAAVLATLALPGCGGGGGGDGGGTPGTARAPTISSQPTDLSVVASQPATFTVLASGSAPLSYQWQRSADSGSIWVDIAGATAARFTLDATTVSDDGTHLRVRVSNGAGSVVSGAARLTVQRAAKPPAFTLQPQSQNVTAPSSATFAVAVTGSPTPTLRWQVSSDGGTTFSNINGATAMSYTTPATTPANDGLRYRVVATNSVGSATSTEVQLSVAAAHGAQRYVYVSGSWGISGFAVSTTAGAAVPTPGSPYATSPSHLLLHPSGNFLYAAVGGTSGGVWGYRIDPTDGRLTVVPGSPFATSFGFLSPPTLDSGGRYMVLANGFSFAVYRIDASTGALTSAGTVLFPTSRQVAFSADGRFMFAYESATTLRTLRSDPPTVGPASSLQLSASFLSQPVARGNFLVAALSDGRIASLAIDASSGALSLAHAATTGLDAASMQIAPHPSGTCFVLGALNSGGSTAVRTVTLNAGNGAVSLGGAPLTINGGDAHSLLLSPSGDYGYLAGGPTLLSNRTTPLDVDASGCTVALNPAGEFLPDITPMTVALDAGGDLAFGSRLPDPVLHILRVDATTRRLAPVAGSPVPLPAMPNSFVVR